MAEEGRTPDNDPEVAAMHDFYESWGRRVEKTETDPKWQKNNLEYDLRTTDWILKKVRESDIYAQNLYAALCNVEWRSKAFWPTLKEENWGCTWRYAGGIIADMRGQGDYIDWYCSGKSTNDGSVGEGTVTEEIEKDLDKLGWIPIIL